MGAHTHWAAGHSGLGTAHVCFSGMFYTTAGGSRCPELEHRTVVVVVVVESHGRSVILELDAEIVVVDTSPFPSS